MNENRCFSFENGIFTIGIFLPWEIRVLFNLISLKCLSVIDANTIFSFKCDIICSGISIFLIGEMLSSELSFML